jgi:hypothetical protein
LEKKRSDALEMAKKAYEERKEKKAKTKIIVKLPIISLLLIFLSLNFVGENSK